MSYILKLYKENYENTLIYDILCKSSTCAKHCALSSIK